MKNLIKRVPVPMAGLMLALASAGNLVASYGTIYKNIFGVISAALLVLLILKITADSKAVLEDLKNPVIASVSPTFSMGLMILSTYLKPYSASAAFIIWIAAILIHCMLMVYFTRKFILNFDIKKIFPSYFVVYVGIVVASVTAPAFNVQTFGRIVFWFGFTAYLILLPVVLYRILKIKSIPEPALPTVTIFAAPASLCLAGYMNSFGEKNMLLVWLLTAMSLIMLLGVLIYMPKLLKLKFYPSYSAFTFPCVISAIAVKTVNAFLIKTQQGVTLLQYVVKFEELLAVSIVLYVLIKYTQFLLAGKPAQVPVKASSSV